MISLKAGMGVRLFSDATRELRVELLGGYPGNTTPMECRSMCRPRRGRWRCVLIISRNTLNVNIVRRLGLVLSYQLTYDHRPSGALFDPSGGERPKGLNTHLIVSGSIGW